jgi:hypothetical protein
MLDFSKVAINLGTAKRSAQNFAAEAFSSDKKHKKRAIRHRCGALRGEKAAIAAFFY